MSQELLLGFPTPTSTTPLPSEYKVKEETSEWPLYVGHFPLENKEVV